MTAELRYGLRQPMAKVSAVNNHICNLSINDLSCFNSSATRAITSN